MIKIYRDFESDDLSNSKEEYDEETVDEGNENDLYEVPGLMPQSAFWHWVC